METKFNFKSQICTSREQSERLLALGLKKETADMVWLNHALTEDYDDWRSEPIYKDWEGWQKDGIPAWSLHRLIEMMPKYVPIDVENGPIIDWAFDKWNIMYDGACYAGHVNPYKAIIEVYEWLIKEGYFNKEYLV